MSLPHYEVRAGDLVLHKTASVHPTDLHKAIEQARVLSELVSDALDVRYLVPAQDELTLMQFKRGREVLGEVIPEQRRAR